MRRKFLVMALCLSMVTGLMFTGCGDESNDNSTDDSTKVEENTSPDDESDSSGDSENSNSGDTDSEEGELTSSDYDNGKSVLTLDSGDDFDQFLNEVYITMITQSSLNLHYAVENPGDYDLTAAAGFGETDEEFEEEFYALLATGLAKFDYDSLSESQQILYDKLSYELDMYEKGEEFGEFYLYSLAQNNNIISSIQTMFTEYSIQNADDAENFIEILKMLPDYLVKVEDEILEEAEDGAVITEDMLSASIDFAEDWLSDTPEENVIYLCYENNLYEAALTDEENEAYLSELADVIENDMIPAIEDYEEFLTGLEEYIADPVGLVYLEDGREYYEWLLESYLGTGMTPDELYQYIEDKYNEQLDRIYEIYDEHPLAVTTYSFATSQYSDDPNEVLEALVELAKEEFPEVGSITWILSYLADAQKVDSVVAYYMSPQLDNIGRRVIRINDDNIDNSVELFVTMAHEGIPGHLYQDEYDLTDETGYQELDSQLTYLSYSEGWAMYVEKLAYGWCIKDENQAELRFIDNIMSYEVLSMADILVNYYGYDYDELYEWMDALGYGSDDTVSYVYNFVVSDPCLYPAYGVGYLLMDDTVEALVKTGDTTKEAYEKILSIGSAPYSLIWDRLEIDPIND